MRFPDIYKKENQTASFDNYLIFCGQRWIRTTEGVSQQIYSLPHLATLVFAHSLLINFPFLLLSRFVSQLRCKGTNYFLICKRLMKLFCFYVKKQAFACVKYAKARL